MACRVLQQHVCLFFACVSYFLVELAKHLHEAVGGVAYVGIEVDEATNYPKGLARVVFYARESYVRSIAMRDFAVISSGMERQVSLFGCDLSLG